MDCLYIPKYSVQPPGEPLLPMELACFLRYTGYRYDLLVSPGYAQTLEDAVKVILAGGTDLAIKEPDERIGVGLFHGTAGSRAMPKEVKALLREIRVAEAECKDGDQERLMFFFEENGEDLPPALERATQKSFLEKITVKAVLMGIKIEAGPREGEEGDLLLFEDEGYGEIAGDQIDYASISGVKFENMTLLELMAGWREPHKYFKAMLNDFLRHFLK